MRLSCLRALSSALVLSGLMAGCTEVPSFDGRVSGTVVGAGDIADGVYIGAFALEGRLLDGLELYDYEVDLDVDSRTAALEPDPLASDRAGEPAIDVELTFSDDWEIVLPDDREEIVAIVAWVDANNDLLWGRGEPAWLPHQELQVDGVPTPMVLTEIEMTGSRKFYGTAEAGRDDIAIDQQQASGWQITIGQ